MWSAGISALAMRGWVLSQRHLGSSTIPTAHSHPNMSLLLLGNKGLSFTSHIHSPLSPTAKITTKSLNIAAAFCRKGYQAGQGWAHWAGTEHSTATTSWLLCSLCFKGLLICWDGLDYWPKAVRCKIQSFQLFKDKKTLLLNFKKFVFFFFFPLYLQLS